jgi:hypothetical protein
VQALQPLALLAARMAAAPPGLGALPRPARPLNVGPVGGLGFDGALEDGEAQDGDESGLQAASSIDHAATARESTAIVDQEAAGSFVTFLRQRGRLTGKGQDNELENLARAVDVLRAGGPSCIEAALILLINRLAGILVALEYGDWGLCETLQGSATRRLLLGTGTLHGLIRHSANLAKLHPISRGGERGGGRGGRGSRGRGRSQGGRGGGKRGGQGGREESARPAQVGGAPQK